MWSSHNRATITVFGIGTRPASGAIDALFERCGQHAPNKKEARLPVIEMSQIERSARCEKETNLTLFSSLLCITNWGLVGSHYVGIIAGEVI